MSTVIDEPRIAEPATADLTDYDFLSLINWDEELACTSRSEHPCSSTAAYRARSTAPCTDPVNSVFWCQRRFDLHLVLIRGPVNCHFCSRDITVCWDIVPI